MAHFRDARLQRPDRFNFAIDVVDYWAAQSGDLQAMLWVSKDESQTRSMTFEFFSHQSHRIAALLQRMGIREGEIMVMILPRVPSW
jgi:medium-chain acyl-CoA synthetase